MTPEHKLLVEFYRELKELLNSDKYLAVSDYREIVPKYADIYNFFLGQQRAKTLSFFCKQNDLQKKWVEKFLEYYVDFDDFKTIPASVEKHNKVYVANHLKSEKEYLDAILKKVDPVINLDDEQREVVLSDEDYTLVIAGAGAGKTTTVAAKVRYLVEKRGIKPEQILVISFTNKAVGELRDKINKGLGIPCPVTTFHSTGYAILRKKEAAGKNIVDGGFMFNVINNYLKGNILEQPELVDKLILFFGSYFDAPYEEDDLNSFFNYISKADFSTLKGNMSEYTEEIINKRIGKKISIDKRHLVQLVDGSSVLVVDVDSTLLFHCVDVPKEKTVTAIRHYQVGVIIGDSPTLTGFGSEEELSLEVELLVEDESFMLAPRKHVDRVIYVRYSFT